MLPEDLIVLTNPQHFYHNTLPQSCHGLSNQNCPSLVTKNIVQFFSHEFICVIHIYHII